MSVASSSIVIKFMNGKKRDPKNKHLNMVLAQCFGECGTTNLIGPNSQLLLCITSKFWKNVFWMICPDIILMDMCCSRTTQDLIQPEQQGFGRWRRHWMFCILSRPQSDREPLICGEGSSWEVGGSDLGTWKQEIINIQDNSYHRYLVTLINSMPRCSQACIAAEGGKLNTKFIIFILPKVFPNHPTKTCIEIPFSFN